MTLFDPLIITAWTYAAAYIRASVLLFLAEHARAIAYAGCWVLLIAFWACFAGVLLLATVYCCEVSYYACEDAGGWFE